LLFDKPEDAEPTQVISLDPAVNRTFFFWHIYVSGLRTGAHYAYRVDGPNKLRSGHRFILVCSPSPKIPLLTVRGASCRR
jgi:isoamylase